MATPLINVSVLAPAIQEYYNRVLLKNARPLLTYALFGQKKPMPAGTGTQIKFSRYNDFAPATTPITEGVTPIGGTMAKENVTTTIDQYGDWRQLTDKVQLVNADPVLTICTEKLGRQEGETMDILLRNKLMLGSNVYYAGDVGGRTSVAASISKLDVQRIVKALNADLTSKITKMINPSTGIGTTPIPPTFIAIGHTDLEMTLRSLESDGFVPLEKYPSQKGVYPGEVGSGWGVRWILTTQAPVLTGVGTTPSTGVQATDSKVDVYQTIIFGEEAYAECPISSKSSGVIIKAHTKNDTSDTSDPLNQRSTAGWVAWWAGVILNDDWICRYEHGVLE